MAVSSCYKGSVYVLKILYIYLKGVLYVINEVPYLLEDVPYLLEDVPYLLKGVRYFPDFEKARHHSKPKALRTSSWSSK